MPDHSSIDSSFAAGLFAKKSEAKRISFENPAHAADSSKFTAQPIMHGCAHAY